MVWVGSFLASRVFLVFPASNTQIIDWSIGETDDNNWVAYRPHCNDIGRRRWAVIPFHYGQMGRHGYCCWNRIRAIISSWMLIPLPLPRLLQQHRKAINIKYGLLIGIKENEPSFREEKGFRSASTKSFWGIFWCGESNGKLGWYVLSCRCRRIVHHEHSQNMFTIRSRLPTPLLIHAHTINPTISES